MSIRSVLIIALMAFLCVDCITEPQPLGQVLLGSSMPRKINGLELSFSQPFPQKNFTSVQFIDENVGFISGWDGAVAKTENGGHSWTLLNTGTFLPLHDIYFFDKYEGFVVGGSEGCSGTGCTPEGALILHTTDGGQSWDWVPVKLSEGIALYSISFVNDSTGFAVGFSSILSTKNKGITWKETRIENLDGVMWQIKFLNDKVGLINCGREKVVITIDGGATWTIKKSFPNYVNTIELLDENLLFTAGQGSMQKSFDMGNNWTEITDSPEGIINKLTFKSDKIGYALGQGFLGSMGPRAFTSGSIYFTLDGGNTWKGSAGIPETKGIADASFPTENLGFGVGGSIIVKLKKQ